MSKTYQFNIRPPGKVLREYYTARSRVDLIMGPLGSGKTFTTIQRIFAHMREQSPNAQGVRTSRWFAIRNTYPDLETTTIRDWLAVMGGLGEFKASYPPRQVIRFRLEDGTSVDSEIVFLALDRPDSVKKLRGAQATGFWLNEVKELPKAVVDMADMRHGRYPSMIDGGSTPTWHGMIGDTNAPDEDHWYYRLAEEDHPEGWRFHRQPGGVYFTGNRWHVNNNAENIQNLPDGYYSNGLQGKSEAWIKVNLANEYGFVMDGKPVYPEYTDSVHCSPSVIETVPGLTITIGIDFGLTPAAVFGQQMPVGRWHWIDELVTEDMGAVRFGELLAQKMRGEYAGYDFDVWGDPAGEGRAQTDESTPFQILMSQGIAAKPCNTNDWTIRREAVARPLSRLLMDGKPGLLLSPKCAVTRKGMAGGYNYKRMLVSGDERYRDKPDKNSKFSHSCDAGQYLMVGGGEGLQVISNKNQFSAPVHPQQPAWNVLRG